MRLADLQWGVAEHRRGAYLSAFCATLAGELRLCLCHFAPLVRRPLANELLAAVLAVLAAAAETPAPPPAQPPTPATLPAGPPRAAPHPVVRAPLGLAASPSHSQRGDP